MAVAVLTRLHLLALEQIAGRDVEPAGNRLYQLITGDQSMLPQQANGYQECASAGTVATSAATMSNASRISRNSLIASLLRVK